MLGASFDTVEGNRAFAEKFSFPYLLLCDTDRALGLAYGACDAVDAKYPKRITYVIDREGRIKAALAKVDPKTHTTEVLALLD